MKMPFISEGASEHSVNTVWAYIYNLAMEMLTPTQWIARCAVRLGERWRTVPLTELEAAAVEVWQSEKLRELPPEEAAAQWLSPLTAAESGHDEQP